MAGKDFKAAITRVATKGHGDDSEVEVTLTFPHADIDAAMTAAWLIQAKRDGGMVDVSVETTESAQLAFWSASSAALEAELHSIGGRDEDDDEPSAASEPDDLPADKRVPAGAKA